MKKHIKKGVALLMIIAMATSLSIMVNAKEIMIDDNFSTDETVGKQPKQKDFNGGAAFSLIVNSNRPTSNNKVIISDDFDETNYCLKSIVELKDAADANPNPQNVLYFLVNKGVFIEYTKDFLEVSFDVKADAGTYFNLSMKAGNTAGWGQGIVKCENNKLAPAYYGNFSGNTNHLINIDPTKFYNIKVIFNMKAQNFNYYVDGKLIVANQPIRQDLTEGGTATKWGDVGAFYFNLTHSKGSNSLTLGQQNNLYIDNFKIASLDDEDIEFSDNIDYFDASGSQLSYINTGILPNTDIVSKFNIINRTAETKTITLLAGEYEESEDGTKTLIGWNFIRHILAPGINNIETPKFTLQPSEHGKKRYIKIMSWNALDNLTIYQNAITLMPQ